MGLLANDQRAASGGIRGSCFRSGNGSRQPPFDALGSANRGPATVLFSPAEQDVDRVERQKRCKMLISSRLGVMGIQALGHLIAKKKLANETGRDRLRRAEKQRDK